MHAKFRWNANIPKALRQGHDELRAELLRATMEPGPIGEAAERVAALCLPHFEHEEIAVFPIFGLLDDLVVGEVRPEMIEILPFIAAFKTRQQAIESNHQEITTAVTALMHAAHIEKNIEYGALVHSLKNHERLEDEVIFPAVTLMGKYISARLGID